jgi:hypothetical protein
MTKDDDNNAASGPDTLIALNAYGNLVNVSADKAVALIDVEKSRHCRKPRMPFSCAPAEILRRLKKSWKTSKPKNWTSTCDQIRVSQKSK